MDQTAQTVRYQLGARIALADLLALPPDGNRYGREKGRLVLMAPDDARLHRIPLDVLRDLLGAQVSRPARVSQEPAIAFEKVYALGGRILAESFLGPKSLQPDIACFSRAPELVEGPHGLSFFRPAHLALVVEVLSPSTWRSDCGVGGIDDVDKLRTYLEGEVPEYWLVNPSVNHPQCPVPARSGLFLHRSADGSAWEDSGSRAGRIRSRSLSQVELDLDVLWSECGL